ncbi:MAG: RNA polymerase subunit sigma-70, partial [Oscillospiraceae bacterium]|nr:RNA polymerase subunit sigma-70 [Oscillospiraceae bacterium]
MEESEIIGLFWNRDEKAIAEAEKACGSYCFSIAENILHSREDAEECVSDTWLRSWNVIPPQHPNLLGAFLARITR